MVNIALVITCMIIGVSLKWVKEIPENAPFALNQFLIYVSLPALTLIYIPQIEPDTELLFPVFTSWIVFFLALAIIPLLGRICNWDDKTTGCILLTAGFGNTSFVGFPIIEALYGAEALKIALLVDQPGSFIAITTMGIAMASYYSAGKTTKRQIVRNILFFPPFITFTVALFMNVADVQATGIALGVLERLGATIIPIALISVGLQLNFDFKGQSLKPLIYGLGYKLVIAPLFLFFLYVIVFNGSGTVVEVSIMEAAMAPMITGYILAAMFGLNPRLASLMVGIGVPLSFVTLALWFFFLGWIM